MKDDPRIAIRATGSRANASGVGESVIQTRVSTHTEIGMSADKDRGIRRVKQKRAKDAKKQERLVREAAAQAATAAKPAGKKATA